MNSDQLPSEFLTQYFDKTFLEVIRNKDKIPFSADRILTDLIESGISAYDALDILFTCREYFESGMNTAALAKVLNQAIKEKGYTDSELLTGSLFQQVEIVLNDGTVTSYSFKLSKKIIAEQLKPFVYSSRTFRAIVDEFHRIVRTLRSQRIKQETLENMFPSMLRNTIGMNPFSHSRCDDDYANSIKMFQLIDKRWNLIPDPEKPEIIERLLNSIFRVILLSYEYLPGTNIRNTIHQVNQLVADLTEIGDKILSDKEIYVIGKSATTMGQFNRSKDISIWHKEAGFHDTMLTLMNITHGLMNRGAVLWLIVTDANGNELYSKFGSSQTKRANRSLIAMAISGVQSIVSEITDNSVSEIQSIEGRSIVLEKHEHFSIIALVKSTSHLVRQRMQELSNYVQENLLHEIVHFNGSVNTISRQIDSFVENQFHGLIE